jgi:hypothetical protein
MMRAKPSSIVVVRMVMLAGFVDTLLFVPFFSTNAFSFRIFRAGFASYVKSCVLIMDLRDRWMGNSALAGIGNSGSMLGQGMAHSCPCDLDRWQPFNQREDNRINLCSSGLAVSAAPATEVM